MMKESLGIIEIKELTYTYPAATRPVLDGINLTVERGQFVLLTGPSGCGKTTLCRCLNGLVPHFYNGTLKGEAHVAGLSVSKTPTSHLAQHVGLIFQNPDNQIFALTVEKDIAFGLENLGFPRDEMRNRIDWVLRTTGIEHLRQRAPHELSGGQKQRLAIASVLAMRPGILVLDEPTSFLDPVGADRVLTVLDSLNKEMDLTIILVEHRLDLVAPHVDRVILMKDGKIARDGTPWQVLSDEADLGGVGVPRVAQLWQRLAKEGLAKGPPPLTATALAQALRSLFPQGQASKARHRQPSVAPTGLGELGAPIIEIKGVHYTYPTGVKALDDVSLQIRRGEALAIMGENGAGKTTLVKHFNGLLRPQKGQVYVSGTNAADRSVASLSRTVGLAFQNPDDQIFSEKVEDEVAFGPRNFGFKEELLTKSVEWALGCLDLVERSHQNPFTLSGGERKRVALASVLVWSPQVVILDEPTIGQDYAQKKRLMSLLSDLRSQDKAVAIVTHDVEFVAEWKPRIVLMSKGRIIADGSAEQVLTSPTVLETASVRTSEIARAFQELSDLGFGKTAINVEDAYGMIAPSLRGET